jgi:hypothetical protein
MIANTKPTNEVKIGKMTEFPPALPLADNSGKGAQEAPKQTQVAQDKQVL